MLASIQHVMTRIIVFCLVISTNFLQFQIVKSDRVSSKLDFGQDAHPAIHIKSPRILTNTENTKKSDTTVTCFTTGCNKTITEEGEKDIVSDVVVHVKTSVNAPKSKNETIEETPDVPVVLGYGNSNNPEIISGKSPIFVGDLENNYPSIPESKFEPYQPPHRKYYELNRKQVSLQNDIIYVPYFEQSFHKYHFGEQPQLQYAWTPRGGASSINPVEFKRFEKPTWNRRQWNSGFIAPASSRIPVPPSGYTTCTCQNPGLNWYPTASTWSIQQARHSNTHIDDKLAPLN